MLISFTNYLLQPTVDDPKPKIFYTLYVKIKFMHFTFLLKMLKAAIKIGIPLLDTAHKPINLDSTQLSLKVTNLF